MAIERIFLDWDGPCLPRAAAWLRERFGRGDVTDLSSVLCVLPGARAGRRLLELLAEPGQVLRPPRIITVGALPECLYSPTQPPAGELNAALARMRSLRSADPAVIETIVPHPPADDDWRAWLALARDFEGLHEDLAAEGRSFADVAVHCEQAVDLGYNDAARWHALAAMHEAYLAALQSAGFTDRHAARAAAIAARACRSECDIILIGATDLPRIVRSMLSQVGDRVTALIHAPPTEAAAFDGLGCVVVNHWCDRPIDVPADQIHIVDRPRDQAAKVLHQLAPHACGLAHDDLTIGVGDSAMTSLLLRCLDLAAIPAHAPVGQPLAHSRPATLLAALAAFNQRRRFDDFASTLRHPDLDAYLHHRLTGQPAIADWLSLLDQYISDHLAARSIGDWLGKEDRAAKLKEVYETVTVLLPDPNLRRPLPAWSEPIADLLRHIYAQAAVEPGPPLLALADAIEQIGDALREQSRLDAGDPLMLSLTFTDAVEFTLWRLASAEVAPPPRTGPAVELLGWLELPLDDAPHLIVTGFNEHQIPQSAAGDAFLPDRLRAQLGLLDNRRRYARDAAALTAILHSRKHVTVIAGRRGSDDEPLKPSRLLLTGKGKPLAQLVQRFYPTDPAAEPPQPVSVLLPAGGVNRFMIPTPRLPQKPIDELRVTDFRLYLDCPYRFYLKKIANLQTLDDQAVELDGMAFGNLAHTVLQGFAGSDAVESTDAGNIAACLCELLDWAVQRQLGADAPVAAQLQVMQLRDRLIAFATQQAEWTREGWRIHQQGTERDVTATLKVDNIKMKIKGRIDRIDRHIKHAGLFRIIDYKTGDNGDKPQKTHQRDGKWIDLQLPLYRRLAETLKVTGEVELGYIVLPKKLEETGFLKADWSAADLAAADAAAEQVIRNIRAGVFWPPRKPSTRDDEFSAICMEGYLGRDEIIAAVSKAK